MDLVGVRFGIRNITSIVIRILYFLLLGSLLGSLVIIRLAGLLLSLLSFTLFLFFLKLFRGVGGAEFTLAALTTGYTLVLTSLSNVRTGVLRSEERL